ncbi:hypothetical protein BDB00DRAFT_868085 [Zychaea mexicana]|uniref:uncharacterized protein n=1 Tax=Zychaea mexicana TaxID=64656 RepID=UPI0022FE7AA8|nr:uncharacterized protein BDB00DRAFT_868085 [Zychaea mexicana]KAI9497951.1 hypothetical protein BDB00DRAFT_868085 [Zychaea mexicana]
MNSDNVGPPPLPPRNAFSSDNLAPPTLPPRTSSYSSVNNNTRPRSTSDTTAVRFSNFDVSLRNGGTPLAVDGNSIDDDAASSSSSSNSVAAATIASANPATTTSVVPEGPNTSTSNSSNNNKSKRSSGGGSADAMATAYLERHVREMKRASVAGLAKPLRQNYETRNEDGSVQVNWKEYLEAWVQYIISSFASGQVDDKLEPFSLKVVKSGVDRLYGMVAPLKAPAMTARRIYRWENRWLTGTLALGYLILWYLDLLVPFFFAACIAYIVSIRLDLLAQFGVEALATAADNNTKEEQENDGSKNEDGKNRKSENKHTKQFWKRLKHDLGSTELNYGFTALETKSMNEWRSDIMKRYGPRGQLLFMDILDRLERVKNLLTWKRPEKTRMLLWLLVASAVTLTFLPTRYMTKLVFLWLGTEFFVLQSLRSHYPRHRRLFNIIDWLLWGVPNDAEYAMEVLRLHREEEEVSSPKSAKRRWRRSGGGVGGGREERNHHHLLPHRSDSGEISEPETEEKHQAATSTAATLAIMVAGAAAGQVKHALDEQFERSRVHHQQEQNDNSDSAGSATSDTATTGHSTSLKKSRSSNNLFERKGSLASINTTETGSEVIETYGCVYRGSIPGRIVLTTQGLQFRTSRVTGARILVYYYWRDIVSVRKSKSIDIFVWHTNGLDITTVDGEELHFDNVIKRDDCFNRLVAAAGDRWG